jgi:hypothetical protein
MDLASRTIGGYVNSQRGVDLTKLSGYAQGMVAAVQKLGIEPSRFISGHRDTAQNAAVGGAKYSQHTHGNAVDIDITGMSDQQKQAIVEAAVANGARGIGIYPSGNSLHIDTRQTPALWGLTPGAPYKGMSVDNAPAWAKPALTSLFGRGGAPAPIGGASPITGYINEAGSKFGVSPGLLAAIARRESSNDPNAKNPNSSAAGLFQFTDATWRNMLPKYGGKAGIDANASPFDPRAAATMAALLAKENSIVLSTLIGRQTTDGEVYAAHFLGAKGALNLIRASEKTPDAIAATLFPGEAAVNHNVFFAKDGTPRSVKDVYADLTNMPAAPADVANTSAPAEKVAVKVVEDVQPFQPVKADIRPATQRIAGPSDQGDTELDRLRSSVTSKGRGLLG